jgi:uncharacterized membrane protein
VRRTSPVRLARAVILSAAAGPGSRWPRFSVKIGTPAGERDPIPAPEADRSTMPQSDSRATHDRRASRAVLAAAVLALAFVGGTFLAPVLESAGLRAGGLLRLAYAPLCHQSAERSIAVGSSTQAVCARCAGLYVGAAGGLFAAAALLRAGRLRPRASWLAWAVAPSALDFLAGLAGLPALPEVPRLLLALPAGALAGAFLAVGLADLVSFRRERGPRDPVAPAVVEGLHG